jgi:cyclopropane-fatty-acyl-phospholipid synthase
MSLLPVLLPTTPKWTWRDRVARSIVQRIVRSRCANRLVVIDDEMGERSKASSAATGTTRVVVHDPAAYRELLRHGSVGLAKGYIAGWWDCDDLVGVVRLATQALPAPGSPLERLGRLFAPLRGGRSGGSINDLAKDRADVQAHYDLGDDFFSLFLDPTRTYSCGLFEHPEDTLEQAQRAKLDRICRSLQLEPGDEVLEIGSGWGSFAIHAARHYGCHVTTTTISERQFAYTEKCVHAEGLGHLVTVCNQDYRTLTGTFDKLVSIEMIEAIGWRQLDQFFGTCSALLHSHGVMALQAIVIDDALYERAKHVDDFIKAMVFPGSTIPSVSSIAQSVSRSTDLRIVENHDIGAHYVETLARWRNAFLSHESEVMNLGFDAAFVRLWDLYFAYCQAGFAEGRISDVQMLLAKPGGRSTGTAPAPRPPQR